MAADRHGRRRLRELWHEYEGLIGGTLLFGALAVIVLLGSGVERTPLNFLVALAGVVGVLVLWWAGVGLVYMLGPASRTRWRRLRTIRAAARRSPGAVFVPGYAGHGMSALADERGVLPRSWRRAWASELQVVLAVLPDRVEVWVHGAQEPLWSVRRVEHGAAIERGTVQSDYGRDDDRDVLWFRDGAAAAGVFPQYTVRLLILRDYPALDLRRALRETGVLPDDVAG
ncbi:hypothetical protein [Promicromonospora sp. NPDC023987]|uniref:hypothetical protein n=1 Tax=Promicromonospora sp. NPDC023987 TaxID=3155360 RepID=UPI0033C55508